MRAAKSPPLISSGYDLYNSSRDEINTCRKELMRLGARARIRRIKVCDKWMKDSCVE
jgi:hypothetical protein